MSNPIDKINTVQDINDRKEIINRFRLTGYIDRNDAINKIVSLRSKDSDILAVATAEQISGSVPLSDAPNEALINELQKQIDLLALKLGN